VLTGVTRAADLPVDPAPDVVAPSLADLVPDLIDGARGRVRGPRVT
jgi:hypothetical protein